MSADKPPFNAAAARAKRPCPLWVDAFQRDTQHLEADEIGAYLLILMAMWTREACDFPDDDTRLARVSRVSPRLWKSRIGPVLRQFFKVENGALISKRLREEAAYTERQVTQQSVRKSGEKSRKPLTDNDPPQSADVSADQPRHHPTQLPNYPTEEERVGSDEPTARKRAVCARDHLSPIIGPELAAAFAAHRAALKAPMTPHAGKLMAAKLAAMPDPAAAVTLSLERGWKGVFEPEPARVHPPPRTGRQSDGERLDHLLGDLKAAVAVRRLE